MKSHEDSLLRMVIIENDKAYRDELVAVLKEESSYVCVATYDSARQTKSKIQRDAPDLALVDIGLEEESSGIALCGAIKKKLPRCKVIVLTVHAQSERIFRALAMGADGYILKKDLGLEKIRDVVREVRDGNAFFSASIAKHILRYFLGIGHEILTLREREVLSLITRGRKDKEIAGELGVSVDTVINQKRNALKKLRARDRAEGAVKFVTGGEGR